LTEKMESLMGWVGKGPGRPYSARLALAAGVSVLALAACAPTAQDWMSGQQQPSPALASAQGMPGVLAPLPTSLPGGQMTPVGQRAVQLKEQADALQGRVEAHARELQQARANAIDLSQRYYSTTAGINARLQVGTTP